MRFLEYCKHHLEMQYDTGLLDIHDQGRAQLKAVCYMSNLIGEKIITDYN